VKREVLQQLVRRRGWGLASLTQTSTKLPEMEQTLAAQPMARDVGSRRSRPLSKRLRLHQGSCALGCFNGFNCTRRALASPDLHLQLLVSAVLSIVRVVGSSQLLRTGWIAMLQPPLTLLNGSPWDPCIGALPLAVREQGNNYVIERGLLISAASELTDARDSHEGSVHRGARGQTATGAKMPHFTLREPLDSANATEAAWAENTACSVGCPSDGVSACSTDPHQASRGEIRKGLAA
jgi:hypothetical protein